MVTKTEIPVSDIFERNLDAYEAGKRFIVNQGGSRSGKTYSLIQLLINIAGTQKLAISVCSIAFPHLRRGAIRDFMEIIDPIYKREYHSLTDQVYHFPNGSYIEFFSADDSGKVRGPGRDILFLNEVNLFPQETFNQLNLRTRKTVFMDYNPSDEFHWLYDRILPLPDTEFIQSTYRDNPFLPVEQVREIERLKDTDDDLWRVYGMGERGTTSNTIYPKWLSYEDQPAGDVAFGLDFGFNHPTALVKVTYKDGNLYLEEKFYQSHVTTPELIQAIKPIVERHPVHCDSARPDMIAEIRRAGINAREANKDVKGGINFVKSNRIFVHRFSANLQKEMRTYKWKTTVSGEVMDEPVKMYDDALDAARYGAISFQRKSGLRII